MQASEAITRKSASNLALAFCLLPKQKRRGMSALYAFCREVDDVADEENLPLAERRTALQAWREDIRNACEGKQPRFIVNQELKPFIREHNLPFQLFDELIKGVEMDLEIKRYETMAELEEYCYRVASVVGLLSIEIFGYKNRGCVDYAIYLGKALQLTNILRDVRNDAERGRIYLPLSDCRQFGVGENDILNSRYTDNYRQLAEHIAGRAREFYRLARQSLPSEDRRSMATAELMGSVYWGLLQKLERRGFNVFDHKETRLNKAQKLFLIIKMWCKAFSGSLAPNYGAG